LGYQVDATGKRFASFFFLPEAPTKFFVNPELIVGASQKKMIPGRLNLCNTENQIIPAFRKQLHTVINCGK
jgi:hypothetical protein